MEDLAAGRKPEISLEEILVEHSFWVAFEGFDIAEEDTEIDRKYRKLARKPKVKIPSGLSELRKLYDLWKKGRYTPKRPKAIAKEIEKKYLKKVKSVWEKYSEPFRTGDEYTQELVVKKITEVANTTVSRAKTVVRTETTNYYNEARKKYYDESPDVTHYLFMAVRDKKTTPWCTPNTTDGMRGRHGLVYAKDDPLLNKERPACHWNCRSEILPLSPDNPSHQKLIADASIQRRNVVCFPLPKGWNSNAA